MGTPSKATPRAGWVYDNVRIIVNFDSSSICETVFMFVCGSNANLSGTCCGGP